ncbi:WD repeat-containing protein 75 isoform X2 [Nematostella vectensis]|uniref:WD repeat-containing protein 75 isoform X2 n=1 Tax=Nematostella vectensis TaxID=45351 RepID=UPI002076D6BF|nr:WD repeat-containing protein 75 isoform X2 [Nematostella vectensis]
MAEMCEREEILQTLGKIRLVGGESLVSVPPVFSKDSRNLFCACGRHIHVYSTETGSLQHTLKGHTSQVVGISADTTNELQVISCSGDGQVIMWDFMDGAILKKYEIDAPVFRLYTHPAHEHSIFPVIKDETRKYQLARFNTKTMDLDEEVEQVTDLNDSHSQLAFNNKGSTIAFISKGRKQLRLFKFKTKEVKKFSYKGSQFTCVAFHPSKSCVATGDQLGRIIIWSGLQNESPITMELHWHAHQLASLKFTHDGSYLLSGGEESVLVLWQYQAHTRQFLPRLGAPITNVACSADDMSIVVSHTDNVIRLISGVDLNIKHTIQGLRKASYLSKHLVFDPRTQALVMNCMPGVLQFYLPRDDKTIFLVDVVKQNFVSQTDDEKLYFTQVQHVAFSKTGDWMATVEHRNDHCTTEETRLKFWIFDTCTQSYSVNTIVDAPHSQSVVAVQFQPAVVPGTPPRAITAGLDGKFKMWSVQQVSTVSGEKQEWTCQSIGYYNDMPCVSTVFSEDGTILAVAYEQVLTLWKPETNLLQKVLHIPFPDEKIWHMAFGFQGSSHFLMVATTRFLMVWNLLTCTVMWAIEAKVKVLLADPNTNYFAAFIVFDGETHLYLFDPASPLPLGLHSCVSKKSPVFNAAFDPKSKPATTHREKAIPMSKLYFFTKKQELFTIDRDGDGDGEKAVEQVFILKNIAEQRAEFLKMFSQDSRAVSECRLSEKASYGERTSATVRQMMNTPAHVLPAVSVLCASFLKSLLAPDAIHSQNPSMEVNTDKEMESEDEDGELLDSDDEGPQVPISRFDADSTISCTETRHKVHKEDIGSYDFSWMKSLFI